MSGLNTISNLKPLITTQNEEPLPLNWISITFFATFHIIAISAFWYFSWSALGVAILLHWLFGSIGICLGYHRLLSHRSLQVPKWLEYAIAIVGASAIQGGPIFWVAGHRLHHAYTEDEDKDPHSSQRGFWWSHIGWLLYLRPEFFDYETYKRYAPKLARDPFYCWLNKYHLFLQIPLAALLYICGGLSFVIYGIFLRSILLWHSTWLINSATHIYGYRNFLTTKDNACNLWWAAILTYGEGWHNNHHAYPNVAKTGLHWWEIDLTWWAIRVLQALGLAKKVVLLKK